MEEAENYLIKLGHDSDPLSDIRRRTKRAASRAISTFQVQGSCVPRIQQISNRRGPKWDQARLNETTRKPHLNCENERLRW